jgi:hypothetical protein
VLVTDNAKQQQLIKSLHKGLGENDAEFDDDDPLLRRIRRECEKRVKDCEERLKQSVATTQDERTRLQLHSNEMTMSLVAIRQELEESRASATAARVFEEAVRQQLTLMMDEQLTQTQTIEALRRQVETSNNAVQEAQALLRLNQDQQQQQLRMLPTSNLSTSTGGMISSTPFIPSFSTKGLKGRFENNREL